MLSYALYQQLLWGLNGLVVFEKTFALIPLFKGVPYASRRGYIFSMIKYIGMTVLNLLVANWGVAGFMFISLLFDIVTYVKLVYLKEGYKI